MTHSSVGNRIKVITLEQAVVFVCNFERPRSDRALANQMRDRYATYDWTRRDRLKSTCNFSSKQCFFALTSGGRDVSNQKSRNDHAFD